MLNKIFILLVSFGAINCFPTLNSSLPFEGRIVGGVNANPGEFPFMVSFRKYNDFACGASILNEEWILTAAHCTDKAAASTFSIQYGTNRLSMEGNVIQVKRIIEHEGYSPKDFHVNDIALLQLKTKLPLSDLVKPVKLPKQNQEYKHLTTATLSGWGLDKTGGEVQEYLQKVNIMTFSDEFCTNRHHGVIKKSQICGGLTEGGKGQCSGDSGGPLTVKGVQVGIVSWSIKPCAAFPYPGIFTKVSHYVDWIKKNISKK